MTKETPGEWKWAGLALKALREKHALSQKKLAELAGIDRSRLIALEKGNVRISPHYAELLAPHLKVKNARKLEPPPPAPQDSDGPIARLEAVEAALNKLGPYVDDLAARVAALENQAPPKRRRGGLPEPPR